MLVTHSILVLVRLRRPCPFLMAFLERAQSSHHRDCRSGQQTATRPSRLKKATSTWVRSQVDLPDLPDGGPLVDGQHEARKELGRSAFTTLCASMGSQTRIQKGTSRSSPGATDERNHPRVERQADVAHLMSRTREPGDAHIGAALRQMSVGCVRCSPAEPARRRAGASGGWLDWTLSRRPVLFLRTTASAKNTSSKHHHVRLH
ncbi:hypothetical protein CYLTODRAFT_119929 [Cylindrobasidium torrendii FP15055 ss-10]|uniref:Uncharacterized protein n=1 Tax=Cylindrobasidium torrendii FP15055 ss-10 TaxID=1314674 RepID=A0A0D7B0D3_9AGAR|nr:hypothetical protein CYLTODRAFT_119929 [Cylindrobasidium torrendii FP15055 ss-10]